METHWVANRNIDGKDGKVRKKGDHIPEADDWRDPELWERSGYIRRVQGPPPAPEILPEPEAEPIPEPEPDTIESLRAELAAAQIEIKRLSKALESRPVTPPDPVVEPPAHAPGSGDLTKQAELAQSMATGVPLPRPQAAPAEAEPKPEEPKAPAPPLYTRRGLNRLKLAALRKIGKSKDINCRGATKREITNAILEEQPQG